jgi:hypothetical protein
MELAHISSFEDETTAHGDTATGVRVVEFWIPE